nr:reverse transcriptase domain-containing protein [Tanacetum cinerariifolium]
MVRYSAEEQNKTYIMIDEDWMNVSITFPPVGERPLEGGYHGRSGNRRILGPENTCGRGGIYGDYVRELVLHALPHHKSKDGKNINNNVRVLEGASQTVRENRARCMLWGEGIFRREIMKFTVISAHSPYNGIATLVSQTATMFECRRVGKKQAVEPTKEMKPQEKVGLTEEVLANPAHPNQLVAIGKSLSPEGFTQLKNILKKNKDIFELKPLDMMGVPRRIIKHALNANPSVVPVCQKRKMLTSEKIQKCSHPRLGPDAKFVREVGSVKLFLSRSADKSLPFFETLKDITKENKDDYWWTEDAENAFQ